MSARAQLAIEGSLLAQGDSVRMVCPFCDGGASNEASLVLTHALDGTLLFLCHRAHCTARGRLGGSFGSTARPRPAPERRPPKEYAPSSAIPSGVVDYIRETWHFAGVPVSWCWDDASFRVMMPVLSPKALRRGWVARRILGGWPPGPKTLNEKEVFDQPWVHWPRVFASKRPMYIVEDIPSAERLRDTGVTACALMGVHASGDVVVEIAEVARRGRTPIIIALDRDAVSNAFELRDRLFHSTEGNVVVAVLKDVDVKNMNHEELADWLSVGF